MNECLFVYLFISKKLSGAFNIHIFGCSMIHRIYLMLYLKTDLFESFQALKKKLRCNTCLI